MMRPAPLPVPHCLGFFVELLFPGFLVVHALTNEGREHSQMQQNPVDDIGREAQRLSKIDEQNHACMWRIVPGFVLIGVIEYHRFAFTPAIDVVLDADSKLFARLWYDQAEV